MEHEKVHLAREKCVQCGAADLEDLDEEKLKCRYCGCVYRIVVPRVFINRGADVTFGKGVSIRGGVEIESGAKVNFKGHVEILEDGIETS